MFSLKFKTITDKKEIEQVIETLKNGRTTPFWKLIEEILDENIRDLVNALITNDHLTLEENVSLKRMIRVLDQLKHLPANQIKALLHSGDTDESRNFDPYY